MSDTYRVVVENAPSPDDLGYLEERFIEAVARAGRFGAPEEFAVLVRDAEANLIGGVSASVFGGYCEFFDVWVEESHRGHGLGHRLIRAAEDEARRRGCGSVLFVAYDLMTPGMYERWGYDTVGVVEDCPVGSTARWFRKRLDRPGP